MNRLFWIYFFFAFFFSIIGVSYLIVFQKQVYFLVPLWLLTQALLLLITYQVTRCYYQGLLNFNCQIKKIKWVTANLLFLLLLFFSMAWTMQLQNKQVLVIFSVLNILGGMLFLSLINQKKNLDFSFLPIKLCLVYILSWIVLSLYSATKIFTTD